MYMNSHKYTNIYVYVYMKKQFEIVPMRASQLLLSLLSYQVLMCTCSMLGSIYKDSETNAINIPLLKKKKNTSSRNSCLPKLPKLGPSSTSKLSQISPALPLHIIWLKGSSGATRKPDWCFHMWDLFLALVLCPPASARRARAHGASF